ncbi:uncharacterized protein LOC119027395 [Acanthopagrus latus]|uniref:uncharacterized protein LOC119027395 n=1 Tax=Acanthopagrus latus TaxID=8177 RepID=UPI00187CFD97|nr:uncharacterized protein LOC119027395 [Acanthopagrus latus]
MKFLVSDLLFALVLHALPCCGASSDKFLVTQSSDVSVREGETVNIACCLTGEFERATVTWLKNQTSMGHEILMKKPESSLQKNTSDCSNKTFINIIREDSERYTCKVNIEIPFHIEVKGNGTVITVMARDNAADNTGEDAHSDNDTESHWEEVLIHVMRCLPILALVVSFFCLNKLGTKAQQHAQVAPGNKIPSEQRTEEDQEEEGRDEREIEEENKNRDEDNHELSDVSNVNSRVEKDKEPLAVSSQMLSA